MQIIRRPATSRRHLARVLAAVAAAGALLAAPAAASAATGTARPAATAFGGQAALTSISCDGPSFCMAVGSYTTTDHVRHAQAMIWNGTSWRTLTSPPGQSLASVSCPAPGFCMAAGGPTGAERWNGTAWRRMPSPKGGIAGVSCGSRKLCMIISGGVVRSWNGVTWRLWSQATGFCGGAPGPCGLASVSCGSPANCVAVGTMTISQEPVQNAVAAEWNGRSWSRTLDLPAVGNPAQANAVSCTGPFCMATGSSSSDAASGTVADAYSFQAATRSWTGAPLDLGNLCVEFHTCYWTTAVSCASPAACMTLGGPDGSQWWNGTAWTSAPAISAGRGSALQGLSCDGTSCLAVGFRTVAGRRRTLAERWSGSAWTIIPTPR